eukprot:14420759-Alexandrium_andersonii.AAC.1
MTVPSVSRLSTGHEPPVLLPAPDRPKHHLAPAMGLLGASVGRGSQEGYQEPRKALDHRDAPERQ